MGQFKCKYWGAPPPQTYTSNQGWGAAAAWKKTGAAAAWKKKSGAGAAKKLAGSPAL